MIHNFDNTWKLGRQG